MKPILQRRPRKRAYYYVLSFFLGMLIAGGIVIAATLLVQITPVVAAASLNSASCKNPTSLTANVSYFLPQLGVTQYVRFTCTADGSAYTATQSISGTPTFSLPTGATSLYSFRASTAAGTTCAAGTGAWQMTSGSAHGFPSGTTTWDYCMVISSGASANLSSFTITWTG